MSIVSHSQMSAVRDRSMGHAFPVNNQPSSVRDATSVKVLRSGVSEAALFTGGGNEARNVQWQPIEGKHETAGAADNDPTAKAVAPVPANLPSAAELKKQIAKFLENNLGKSSSKAKAVAARIPTNDPVRLKNVIDVLTFMKIDRGMRYDSLKENISWPADTLCCWNDYRGTSADDRLTLRALMLYVLSNVDVSARDSNPTQYAQMIKSAIFYTRMIKTLDVDYLRNSTSDSILIHGEHGHVVPEGARIMPTIVKQLEEITAKL